MSRTTHITGVGTVGVPVTDQDRALEFYVGKLGFEKRRDIPARGTGVADALLAEAERQVTRAGHSSVWLAVVAGNARARKFYERRGWSDGGPFTYAAAGEDGPIAVPARRYVKRLS
jgi:catechol 2,3-dioxygenase-like lactoylglutathione lyase family enzyme